MMEGKALAFGRLPRHPAVWRLRSLSVYSTVLLGWIVVERASPRHVRLMRISWCLHLAAARGFEKSDPGADHRRRGPRRNRFGAFAPARRRQRSLHG